MIFQKSPGGGEILYYGSNARNIIYRERFSYSNFFKNTFGDKPVILFDIGARYGESSAYFHSILNIERSFLFEPNPEAFLVLKNQLSQNQTGFNFALSSSNSMQEFYIHENAGMSSLVPINPNSIDSISYSKEARIRSSNVRTVRLDDLKEIPFPTLTKIDVQSHEAEVLKGGKLKLAESELILIEVNLYDMYTTSVTIGEIESLLPNHKLFSIPHISYNPIRFSTDWVECIFVRKDLKL